MKYKKEYCRPSMEVIEMKRTMLLSGSFVEQMDDINLLEDYFDIL